MRECILLLLLATSLSGQAIRVDPVFGFDLTTPQGPTSRIANERRIVSAPFFGLEVYPFSKMNQLRFGFVHRVYAELISTSIDQVSFAGDALLESQFTSEVYGNYSFESKIEVGVGGFRRVRRNRGDFLFGRPSVFYGISGSVGYNIANTRVSLRTLVYLDDFSALVGTENYELRFVSPITAKRSPKEKNDSEKGQSRLVSSFRLGIKFFLSNELLTIADERSPAVSYHPSVGYELFDQKTKLAVFVDLDPFYRLNFGVSVRDIQQEVSTISAGLKYYTNNTKRNKLYFGLSYGYGSNSNLERFSNASRLEVRGIGMHAGLLRNDRVSYELQTLLMTSSTSNTLLSTTYTKLGCSYHFFR